MRRIRSSISAFSPWLSPAAGSSSSSSLGRRARARAISDAPLLAVRQVACRTVPVAAQADEVQPAVGLVGASRSDAPEARRCAAARRGRSGAAAGASRHARCPAPTSSPNRRRFWKVRATPQARDGRRPQARRCPRRAADHGAAGRAVEARDAVERAGLPGAVRPDDRDDLALVDRERQAVDGPTPPKARCRS